MIFSNTKHRKHRSIPSLYHIPTHFLRYYQRLTWHFHTPINVRVQVRPGCSRPREQKRRAVFDLDHQSAPCHSNGHHCHLSTLQLNSTYPNLDTFIHHRRCRRTRTVFSGTRIALRRMTMNLSVLSDAQLLGLEKRFETQKYLSTPDRIELADMLHLSQLQVKTW